MPTCTSLVHTGGMSTATKEVRRSITLPAKVASEVGRLARTRRVSATRVLVQLIEDGLEVQKQKEREFFDLAERFRNATDPEEVKRLGDQLGRMVFG